MIRAGPPIILRFFGTAFSSSRPANFRACFRMQNHHRFVGGMCKL